MKKLILEELAVESFVTGSMDARGTVAGYSEGEVPVEGEIGDETTGEEYAGTTTLSPSPLPFPTYRCFCTHYLSTCLTVSFIQLCN